MNKFSVDKTLSNFAKLCKIFVYCQYSSNKPNGDFDSNLPKTVTLLRHEKNNAKVYLIGTLHFSKESQEDVIKVYLYTSGNLIKFGK